MFRLSLFLISYLFCLNLGIAQTSVPTQTPEPRPTNAPGASSLPPLPVNPGSIVTPPTLPSSSGDSSTGASTPADDLKNLVGSINAGKGKYEEYQSICRENLYDKPSFLTAEVQQQRIDELKEKIKSAKPAMKYKIKLLKEYVDQGKKLEAEQQYVAIKAEKTNETANKIAEAIMAMFRQDVNKAETTLSKVVIDEPKNTEAMEYLAEMYTAHQKYFEAASAYFDLIKLTKENFDLQLCIIHTLDSQHKEAEKFCRKANQFSDKNPYPYIYLGISQREQTNIDQAIQNFKESLRRQQTEMAFSCLGEIYFIKEKFGEAVKLFQRALKISPKSYRALTGMAWAQIKDKKPMDALESFKRACSLNRNVAVDLRRAYKILNEEKNPQARLFADQAQKCYE